MESDKEKINIMIAFDSQSVQEKLKTLREIIEKLEELNNNDYQAFVEDFKISDSALRNLTLGIDVIVDIGGHILSEVYQVKADNYSDVIIKLGEVGVIPQDFSNIHGNMSIFYNQIIHDYGHINLEMVYEYLGEASAVFAQFASHFQVLLEREENKSL